MFKIYKQLYSHYVKLLTLQLLMVNLFYKKQIKYPLNPLKKLKNQPQESSIIKSKGTSTEINNNYKKNNIKVVSKHIAKTI